MREVSGRRVFSVLPYVATLVLSSSIRSQPKRISLQEAAEKKIVDVSAKGGYIGDKVKIRLNDIQHPGVEIAVVAGDMLVNKNRKNQNLVLGKLTGPEGAVKEGEFNKQKAYSISVPAGDEVIAEGGWTFCVDAHKNRPKLGDKFDVGPNLRDFYSHENVSKLLSLVQVADKENLYNETTQYAVWFYTNPDDDTYGAPTDLRVRNLISVSDGNPDEPKSGFPHLSNPNKDSPNTRAVIPPEANTIYLSRQEPSRVVTLTFVRPNFREFCITVPQDANLNVAVRNISSGNIWRATIYEKTDEHWELQATTIGDGSTVHYSEAAKADIVSGMVRLMIRNIGSAGIWPSKMSVKLWIDGANDQGKGGVT